MAAGERFLHRRERRYGYQVAREELLRSGGDYDVAIGNARRRVSQEYGSALVAIAIVQLIIALYRLWRDLPAGYLPPEDPSVADTIPLPSLE